jgi:nitronate monooxygenase
VESALAEILNLLLESERAGVAALEALAGEVAPGDLRQLLLTSRQDEIADARGLEDLIRANGGRPSNAIGPFAAKVAALGSLQERLKLLIHGEEWVARKVEEALALAPPGGPINEYLQKMARRHRFEVEWGRAELIRLMSSLK